MGHELRTFLGYHVPIARLQERKRAGMKIVPLHGKYAGPQMKKEVRRLARIVGPGRPLVFPGGHTGYVIYPEEFADRLHEVLG